jgi:hypothetical protein
MRSRAEVNVEGAGPLVRSRCKCSLSQPPRNRTQCAAPLSVVSPASLASRIRVSSRARGSECHAYNDHRSPFARRCRSSWGLRQLNSWGMQSLGSGWYSPLRLSRFLASVEVFRHDSKKASSFFSLNSTFEKPCLGDGFISTAHCFPAQHASLIINDESIRARLALRVALHTFVLYEAPMRNQHRLRSNSRLESRRSSAPVCTAIYEAVIHTLREEV